MKKPSVCISPLDWGLGHATRCISLIKAFESLDYQIYIATEGYQEVILKEAIPTATFLKLKGYRIKYAKNGFLLPLVLLLQLPKIVISIIGEHRWLQKAQKRYQFDLIVSDNRFGFFHSSISSVFITHQLSVQTPYTWTTNLFQKIQYAWLKKFTACWIPDLAGKNNLAGVLANPLKKPTTRLWYMGCLSRLLLEQNSEALTQSIKNKFLGIISGPEPQRTLLENLVWNSGNILQLNFVMVAGTPLNKEAFKKTNHSIMYPHLSGKDLMKQIQEAEYIICRGGYTTLMELIPFRKKLILIPTPGQTEQIYLGALWQKNGWAICCDQAEFDLAKVLDQASRFNFIQAPFEAFSSFALKNELKQLTL
jgi:hypothetical protein